MVDRVACETIGRGVDDRPPGVRIRDQLVRVEDFGNLERVDVNVKRVIDRGPGFESAPLRRVGPLSEAGRGLWLIRHFGRDLKVEHIPGFGNHVRVELPVDLGANVVETVPDVQPAGMQR